VHERNCEGLAALLFHQLTRGARDSVFIQLQQHLVIGANALRHFEAAVSRHQGWWRTEEQVVEIITRLTPDLDAVAKSIGGQQADGSAGTFDDGVGHQRGAMDHTMKIGRLHIDLAQQPRETGDDGGTGIVGCGRQLAGVHQVAPRIMQHKVGEGAIDINTDTCNSAAHAASSSP